MILDCYFFMFRGIYHHLIEGIGIYSRFVQNVKTAKAHSHPHRPRSFWAAPRIATSGQIQRHSGFEWLCKHNRLRPEPIRFIRLDSKHAQSDGKSVNHRLPLLDLARGRDSWCWPKGARPLETRMAKPTFSTRHDAIGTMAWACAICHLFENLLPAASYSRRVSDLKVPSVLSHRILINNKLIMYLLLFFDISTGTFYCSSYLLCVTILAEVCTSVSCQRELLCNKV